MPILGPSTMIEGRAKRHSEKETKPRIVHDQGQEGRAGQKPRLWVSRAFSGRGRDIGRPEPEEIARKFLESEEGRPELNLG